MEYRIWWSSSSNISFHGKSDWNEWGGFEENEEEVEEALSTPNNGKFMNLPQGLEEALEYSGFDWGVEIREKEA